MKKYFDEMYYAYRTGHLFNYFGIVPPEWLIDVLNFFKRIIFGKEKRFVLKQNFHIKNSELTFIIDSKYEHRIVGFFDYLNNLGEDNSKTIKKIKILVGDYKTKFDEDFDIFLDLADETDLNKIVICPKNLTKNFNEKYYPSDYIRF